jgi:ABC-2 type transport system ATP-binding protein
MPAYWLTDLLSSETMTVIVTNELRKDYGDIVAVHGLTLTVHSGEVFGFLGPNGAGKTTSIKMLLGLVHPTSGQARLLDGKPGETRVMQRVGFLPEHFRFHPWLKAGEFLDVHGRLLGMSTEQRRQRIPVLLGRVGLADRADTRLGKFSKGMTQRIGIAQALLNNPEVVFLDEPTSGLDPLGRRLVRDIIADLREAGTTVFLNSHFLSEVELTCDRIAIIDRGRVVRQGVVEELTEGLIEVKIRAGNLTDTLVEGLSRWGQVIARNQDRIEMQVESEAELPEIANWLVSGGAYLYRLTPQRLSLEELFVRAVAEEL